LTLFGEFIREFIKSLKIIGIPHIWIICYSIAILSWYCYVFIH